MAATSTTRRPAAAAKTAAPTPARAATPKTATGASAKARATVVARQPSAAPARSAAYTVPNAPPDLVSARQTEMPLNTNGIVMTASVSRMDSRPVGVSVGLKGMARWATNVAGTLTAKSSATTARRRGNLAASRLGGHVCTRTAPAVIPRSAAATARNAKWYHIVTLKILVSRISYISVAAAIANTPTHRARWLPD